MNLSWVFFILFLLIADSSLTWYVHTKFDEAGQEQQVIKSAAEAMFVSHPAAALRYIEENRQVLGEHYAQLADKFQAKAFDDTAHATADHAVKQQDVAPTGTGVGEPQGFLNSPAAVKVTPNHGANTIDFIDVATMYAQMWPPSLMNAVWLCSPDALLQLQQLAVTPVSAGTTQAVAPPGWLTSMQAIDYPGGGNGDGVHYRLMGRPLIVSEKMPSYLSGNSTTAGALTFVDLSYYLLGDRQSMQIASSADYLFASDLMAYRVIERLDGRFWLQSAITPANGSANTLSPLVLVDSTS
jgi:hypothetical protein